MSLHIFAATWAFFFFFWVLGGLAHHKTGETDTNIISHVSTFLSTLWWPFLFVLYRSVGGFTVWVSQRFGAFCNGPLRVACRAREASVTNFGGLWVALGTGPSSVVTTVACSTSVGRPRPDACEVAVLTVRGAQFREFAMPWRVHQSA